jgi:DNA-directed RNA polymerase II subunit RPB1
MYDIQLSMTSASASSCLAISPLSQVMSESQRHLTADEIDSILNEFHPHPSRSIPDLQQAIANGIQERLKQSLSTIQLYPSQLPVLRDTLKRRYYQCQSDPGESVGIVTAQSIGERQTQSTLNTFHASGITSETVITGVPRFNELLNATKKPKAVISSVYFSDPALSIAEARHRLGNQLVCYYLRDVSETVEYVMDPTPLPEWYTLYTTLYEWTPNWNTMRCIRIQLARDRLYYANLAMYEIKRQLEQSMESIHCAFSPQSMAQIDVWVPLDVLQENSSSTPFNASNQTLFVYMDQVLWWNLKDIRLTGVEQIEQVFYKRDPRTNGWYMECLGNQLYTLMSLPGVDVTRTRSNHMWEIYQVFGIEAARQFMLEEMTSVIASDSYLNKRHIQLLVDMMVYTGTITSVSRYGVHRNQSGPLSKSSFEESMDNFLKAGMYGDIETTRGVSASIMVGKPIQTGTGMCDLYYQQP